MLYPYRKSTWIVIIFLLVIWPAFSVLVSSTGEMPAKISNLTLEVYLPTLLVELLLILTVGWALLRSKESPATVGLVGFNLRNFTWGVLFLGLAIFFFSVLSQIFHGLEQPKKSSNIFREPSWIISFGWFSLFLLPWPRS